MTWRERMAEWFWVGLGYFGLLCVALEFASVVLMLVIVDRCDRVVELYTPPELRCCGCDTEAPR